MRKEIPILRKNVYNFIQDKIFTADIVGPVLEIGPMCEQWTPVKKYYVNTREHFNKKNIEYLTCDVDKDLGVDYVTDILNIEKHVKENSLGAVIALEVLEHVSNIWEVPDILDRILKPKGLIFISTPYYFFRHSPFPDYWRISEDGLRLLFSKKFDIEIVPLVQKDDRKPLHYTLIGRKK